MRLKLFLSLIFLYTFGTAQVTNEGRPLSWDLDNTGIENIQLPGFDLQALIEEDAVNDAKGNTPWRFGYEHDVNFGLNTYGTWTELQDGSRYWLINISSSGAKTMNFIFDEFYIPEGGKLYFYNAERTDLLGAYTYTQNREDKLFGSWLVDGDNIFIEYYEPADKIGLGKLNINKAVHGYRSIADFHARHKNLNSSGDCNLDVDCSIGSDFDTIKDELKKSVGIVNLGSGVCSGSLINNTSNDGTPYFITANHCLGSSPSIWSFRFNWRSPNPVCASFTNSTNGPFNQTASGSVLRATNASSDFALVEITANIPSSWDLVWSGWDRTTSVPNFTIGIHHPNGDIMKVCRDDDSPISINNGGEFLWLIEEWETGVTEPGSSGSPLYNPQGQIIGFLSFGAAACNGTVNNGQFDAYGRLNQAWNGGTNANSRLRDWLDPTNTGVTTLNAFPDNLNVVNFEAQNINIFPNPATDNLNIDTNYQNLAINIYDINGKLVLKSNKKQINISSLQTGIYLLNISSENSNNTITKKLIVR